VETYWELDASLAEARLRAFASEVDRPRRDANLRVVGATVAILPAESGRALHVQESADWLRQNAAEVLSQRRWDLQVLILPPVAADVSAAVAEAQQFLSHSLTLDLYDPIVHESSLWTVGPEVWAPWLRMYVDIQQSDSLQWEVDAAAVEASLIEQIGDLDAGRSWKADQAVSAVSGAISSGSWQALLRVYHEPTQHTVQEGETLVSIASDYGLPYPYIEQANSGVSENLQMGQVLQIPSPDVLLPLPIVPGKRITVSLGSQMMWAYENDALKWQWPVSTGLPSSPTTTGVFQVQFHELDAYAPDWDLNMPHFLGIYRPVPDLEVTNGFHGFPSKGGAQVIWSNSLGQPVTYGCILVSSDNAVLLYDWAEDGTIVVVRP
jgi:lipoprotein-anchoring transpeptidase ErfK/SrfK